MIGLQPSRGTAGAAEGAPAATIGGKECEPIGAATTGAPCPARSRTNRIFDPLSSISISTRRCSSIRRMSEVTSPTVTAEDASRVGGFAGFRSRFPFCAMDRGSLAPSPPTLNHERSAGRALAGRASSRRGRLATAQNRHRGAQAEEIAFGAEAGDLSLDDVGEKRVAAELLSLVDVREVNLDDGQADGEHGVPQRDRRVRVRAGVEDDRVEARRCLLDARDELTL